MNREQLAQELDQQIDGMISAGALDDSSAPLLRVANRLRLLPTEEFRQSLKAELLEHVETAECPTVFSAEQPGSVLLGGAFLPSFAQKEFGALPADPRSVLLSFASHVAVVALIASGIWVGHQTVLKTRGVSADLTYIPLPVGNLAPQGGGSGGDHSLSSASRGTPPKFADEQLAPPVIVVRNEHPKLQVDPTVLGPPDIKLPQSKQLGDLISSNIVIPSNGTGGGGGIGNNYGTGDGNGKGPGVGIGEDGGIGGGALRPGNGVSAPRELYAPDPEYSEEARRVKHQGNVVLSLIVDAGGRPRNIRVARSLGMGLDEKALEAVQKWTFAPGMKDGRPVATQVNIEVYFRLY